MPNLTALNPRGARPPRALPAGAGWGGPHPAPPPAHWDYDHEGPDHWADLDKQYATCRNGHAQSPVDLPGATETHPTDHIEIDYRPIPTAALTNNGHAVQADIPAGSGNRIIVDGTPFSLRQYHFHLPSEHTVDGAEAAMELHLVHADQVGRLAVLAVLLRAQSAPAPLSTVLTAAPDRVGATRTLSNIDPNTFLPDNRTQFRYEGSLTTPPCTEGVAWIVLRDPSPVTITEVDRYRSLFPHSNRPTQPRYDRPIILAGTN
ncbi:carbonic anhydrase [Nocardia neocaledoniensis]|uniref:carbonic anhydrase n=1 Tax=Nocardia neocaledoniensis TaxID=236511 RepID=UPI002458E24A|nr:carbonic anhydrase family protein [Nocardia neocaledoniensis]